MTQFNKPAPMLVEIVAVYQVALDRIDDYFEYSYDGERDKAFISGILNKLHSNATVIASKYNTKLEK